MVDPDSLDSLVGSWLTFDQVAAELGTSPNKVRQLVRERQLVAVRRSDLRQPAVPAACILDGNIVKGLPGTLTLLADHGFARPSRSNGCSPLTSRSRVVRSMRCARIEGPRFADVPRRWPNAQRDCCEPGRARRHHPVRTVRYHLR